MQEYAHYWFIGKILKNINLVNMKKLMLFLLLLFSINVTAQNVVDSVSVAETNDGKQLWGKTLELNKNIQSVATYDSLVMVLACDTTKKGEPMTSGHLYALNAENLDVLWGKPLDLSLSTVHSITKQGVLLSTTLKSNGKSLLTLADSKTGQSLWTQYLYPVYINDSLDIVVGLDKIGSSNTYAYRLHDGKLLWNTDIPMTRNIGWERAVMVDSTHLVVVGDDINEIDITTGKMWKVKAKTGIKDTKGMALLALTNVVSVASAVGFSSPIVTFYYNLNPYTITGLTSNILQKDACIYVSDRNYLYCLGTDSLQVKWKYNFEDKESSTSELMMRDGKVFMLNYGYGDSMMRGRIKCGKPFLAVFDALTGKLEKFLPLYDKKHIMNDGFLSDNGVFLAGSEKAVYCSFQDQTINVKDWDKKQFGSLFLIPNHDLYAFHGMASKLTLVKAGASTCPMLTDKNKLCVLDDHMNILDTYELGETFAVRFKIDDAICLQNNVDKSNYWLIYPDGTALAKFKWQPSLVKSAGNNNIIVVYKHKISTFKL